MPGSATPATTGRASPAVASGRGFSVSRRRRPDRSATGRRSRGSARSPIPPAWTDVWICPRPERPPPGDRPRRARPQAVPLSRRATARGATRRSSTGWSPSPRALPAIREQVDGDLARPGLPAREGPRRRRPAARADADPGGQRRVRAAEPRVRPDDAPRSPCRESRARAIRFRFRGQVAASCTTVGAARPAPRAPSSRRCQDLPGPGAVPVRRRRRRGPRRRVRGRQRLPARDHAAGTSPRRTSGPGPGTVLAYRALRALGKGSTDREKQRNVVEAIQATADSLGNTPAVARQEYVHPAVLDAYLDGRIRAALVEAAEDADRPPGATEPDEERAVVALLSRSTSRRCRPIERSDPDRRSPAARWRPAQLPADAPGSTADAVVDPEGEAHLEPAGDAIPPTSGHPSPRRHGARRTAPWPRRPGARWRSKAAGRRPDRARRVGDGPSSSIRNETSCAA